MKFLRTLLVLGRVSNLPTVWTNVLAGWFLVGGGKFGVELALIMLGISLLYVAGMTLNDAFDQGWDKENAPERPIPSGAISGNTAWTIGLIEMVSGIAVLLVGTSCEPLGVVMLLFAIMGYNWLHKRWMGSVLLMGLCRALVYLLAGSAAFAERVPPTPLLFLAGTMLLYVAGITFVARFERSEKRAPVLFGQFLLFCPVVALTLVERTPTNTVFLGLWLAWMIISLVTIRTSIPRGVAFLIAGIVLIDAAAIASVDSQTAMFTLFFMPLTLLLQKFIPAT